MVQLIINNIISGLTLSLVVLSFNYIFRVTKVFHMAHGGIFVISAYLYWFVYVHTLNHFIASLLSIVSTIILIFIIEKLVYLPLFKKQINNSSLITFIASMGLYTVIINIIAAFFGNSNISLPNISSNILIDKGIYITDVQLIQLVVSLSAILVIIFVLKLSSFNKIFIAISDSDLVSKVIGINIFNIRVLVFIVGSIITSIASVLILVDVGINPQSGMTITLAAMVISLLVSRLNISVLVVFSLMFAILQGFIEYFLNSQWRDGLVFILLLIVILYKTEGVINYNLRKDSL